MKEKAARLNVGTGIAIGLPFLILGIVQKNLAFFIIGVALAISLSASSALKAKDKNGSDK
ncbi:hypothetical protein QMA09_05805 [Planococcus sp. APC 3906]|uniref:hypothetical protein n=1 Tax=Planococcus sp. APC 3906 TaxID=3035194 RepID=UPI0025B2A042|nr:hypothetical protein [Planococcus sp. APC 3906]MDN3449693.1 hypothetical protein [Planococcus sp. APC 3906]